MREAYEQLCRPESLRAAYARAPFDAKAHLAAYEQRFAEKLAEGRARHERTMAAEEAGKRFAERFSRMTLVEALAAAKAPPP